MTALEFALNQIWLYRFLVGGIWVKTSGTWSSVSIALILADGSRVFSMEVPGKSAVSFHETNMSIQAIQKF